MHNTFNWCCVHTLETLGPIDAERVPKLLCVRLDNQTNRFWLITHAHCRRMKWREQQPITVLELRCRRLSSPLVLPQDSSFYGCFSWVDLHGHCQGKHAHGEHVIGEEDFRERQAGLRAALHSIEATPMQSDIL